MKKLNTVYIGVGTNLGDKLTNIHSAYQLIQSNIGNISKISSIYRTPPWGFESTEEFYNSVLKLNTYLSAEQLLDALQYIEKLLGKQQQFSIGYSSRLIDLDIIDYNHEIIDSNRLSIPHSHLSERNFVLLPLLDVSPNWRHPKTNKTAIELITTITDPIFKVDY